MYTKVALAINAHIARTATRGAWGTLRWTMVHVYEHNVMFVFLNGAPSLATATVAKWTPFTAKTAAIVNDRMDEHSQHHRIEL